MWFFFFKQKTAYEMRISDWSSDVCSSDLQCFVKWVASLTGTCAEVIAIDGKTSRRSHDKAGGKAAIHMVSAFAARQRLVLGQVKIDEKSNEITAIPRLLAMMDIEVAVVTIDAMGKAEERRVGNESVSNGSLRCWP